MRKTAVLWTLALASCAGACDRPSPTAPDDQPAAVTLEHAATVAAAPDCCESGPFTYRTTLTVRETGGVAVTLVEVILGLTDAAGTTQEVRVSPVRAFGTARLPAGGVVSTDSLTTTGSLIDSKSLSISVGFVDDHGHGSSVHMVVPVGLDLTGAWKGSLPIRTDPAADWSLGRLELVQSGGLMGELVSREGVRFPLTGQISGDLPSLSVGGLPGTSTCAGVVLTLTELEFGTDQVQRISGRAGGRCFGTIAGSFVLQRTF